MKRVPKIAFEPHLKAINLAFRNYFKDKTDMDFVILNKPNWKYKYKFLIPFIFIAYSVKSFFQYIFEYDLIHISSAKSGFIAYLASFFGAKYIYTIHGCPNIEVEKKEGFFKYILCILEIFFMKIVVKRANTVYTISNFSKQQLWEFYKIKAQVIYNGYDSDFFRFDDNARKEIRKKLNIKDEESLFISVGRLIDCKGPISVLYIFKEIYDKHKDCKLIFIGQGILKEELLKAVEKLNLRDQVILIDYIENEDIYKYYSASDYFISGCRIEGFGLAALESFACGDVPLLPRAGAFNEIFKHDEFFYEPNLKLISKQQANTYRNEILETFKWENVISEYHKEYLLNCK